ncbi:hypothetical protein CS022_18390 [Veronia nyctiphanis]|uniref:ABC transporter domain-containing protein n=1 Tax=Veronia nyctiphanis TaxID=1278244 RepID=A0A4Q0YMB8_9GAMM|nr:ATP-binding cassette domain-containing protein [Veronia nyctiphanis]RXJ71970.1 hypothetical protein CS022_18390 [Veronia nyctiphanis]
MAQLTVKNVSRKVDGTDILSSVTIAFNHGVTGLIGANGAGKSSLLRAIALLDPISEGDVLIDGKSILENPQALYQQLGFVFQHSPSYGHLSVNEFLHYIAAMKGLTRDIADSQITHWLDKVNMSAFRDRMMSDCSGGMKQRVGIVQALLGNPKVLLLDEPTVALDHNERLAFYSLIKDISTSTTVVIVSHLSDDIEALADHLVFLERGKVTQIGDVQSLRQQASQALSDTNLSISDVITYFMSSVGSNLSEEVVECGA